MVSCASLFSFANLILLTFHECELRKIKVFHDIESWIWPSFYYFVISRRLSSNLIHTPILIFPLSSFHRGKFTPTKFASLAFLMEIDYNSYMYISNSSLEYISTQSKARSCCRRKNIRILLILKKHLLLYSFPTYSRCTFS